MIKLYRTAAGAVAEYNSIYYPIVGKWEELVNMDELLQLLLKQTATSSPLDSSALDTMLPPIGSGQELWACGVTYLRSKVGRQEESKASGGSDFYGKVYDAVRPEVFFKSTPHRVVGHGAAVRIRKDSEWDVPEPELTLVVTSSGKVIGYTIGNDMSSRSIEGENPLYLPQAKTYDQCAAAGPCILVTDKPLEPSTEIRLKIERSGTTAFEGHVMINQMKRSVQELVSFVFRECSFPHGCLIMTGTGIVPGNDFTLAPGDEVEISIDGIGTLKNKVVRG
jgi:2-dehydro-3-deoxy-D-arabinonate dehydratase